MAETPNWQPLSALPMIAAHIDGWLEDNRHQLETLIAVEDKPHVLDDATVARIESVYGNHDDDLALFNEQLRRWQQEPLSTQQAADIARLTQQLAELKTINDRILSLAAQFKDNTIEKVLAKDDMELALEFLAGKRNL